MNEIEAFYHRNQYVWIGLILFYLNPKDHPHLSIAFPANLQQAIDMQFVSAHVGLFLVANSIVVPWHQYPEDW